MPDGGQAAGKKVETGLTMIWHGLNHSGSEVVQQNNDNRMTFVM
jgi:hypothetical protein